MLGTILAIFVYGALILGIIDVGLYIVVKIKEKRKKKIEQDDTNILPNKNDTKNVPS